LARAASSALGTGMRGTIVAHAAINSAGAMTSARSKVRNTKFAPPYTRNVPPQGSLRTDYYISNREMNNGPEMRQSHKEFLSKRAAAMPRLLCAATKHA